MSADRFKRAAKVNDSGSWNKYSYTRGDPVNRADHHGTCDETVLDFDSGDGDGGNGCDDDDDGGGDVCAALGLVDAGGGVCVEPQGPATGINPGSRSGSSTAALLSASLSRLQADLGSADCDKALGASSAAAAEAKLQNIDIGFPGSRRAKGESKRRWKPDTSERVWPYREICSYLGVSKHPP